MSDNFLDDPGQIRVHTDWIIAMDAGDEVRARPDGDTVFFSLQRPAIDIRN